MRCFKNRKALIHRAFLHACPSPNMAKNLNTFQLPAEAHLEAIAGCITGLVTFEGKVHEAEVQVAADEHLVLGEALLAKGKGYGQIGGAGGPYAADTCIGCKHRKPLGGGQLQATGVEVELIDAAEL